MKCVHACVCPRPAACIYLHLIDIYWRIASRHTAQLPEQRLPAAPMKDLTRCCPRCSGFLFQLWFDYVLLITSLTNDVDWHHDIVVCSGSLGMQRKGADGWPAMQSRGIINTSRSLFSPESRAPNSINYSNVYILFQFELSTKDI